MYTRTQSNFIQRVEIQNGALFWILPQSDIQGMIKPLSKNGTDY